MSASAVSRAFTPGASVSPDKRAAIARIAEELGYQPNVMARAITTRRSHVVGLVLFNETNRDYPEVLLSLSDAFTSAGLRIMLFLLDGEGRLDGVLDQVLAYQLDGVVSATAIPAAGVARLARACVPVVFYNRPADNALSPSVSCDHEACGRLIAGRVIGAGHRRIALIGGYATSPVSNERLAGARSEIARGGGRVTATATGDFSYDSGRAAVRAWAAAGEGAHTAIVAASDMMAIGAKDALTHDFGLRVPGDVSVVGFDGTSAARWTSHALTTVGQPIARMADATARMALERIDDPDLQPERRLFPGTLIEGGSLGPPRAGTPE